MGPDFTHCAEPIDRTDGLDEHFTTAALAAVRSLNVDHEVARWPDDGEDAAAIERWYRRQAALIRARVAGEHDGRMKATVRSEVISEPGGPSYRRVYVRVDRARPRAVLAS